MKRYLILLLASVLPACAQSFPVKANSSGAVSEPSNLLINAPFLNFNASNLQNNGGALDLASAPSVTGIFGAAGLTLSTNNSPGTFITLTNSSSGGKQWKFYTAGSADPFPGSVRLTDISDSINAFIIKTTGQPEFPFFSTAGLIVTDSSGNFTSVANGANNTFYGINGSGVAGYYVPPGVISGLTTNAFTYASGATSIASTAAATNGQILIGSTGNPPALGTITQSSANQVVVTNGAGSITLSLPQDINTTSSPTFVSQFYGSNQNQMLNLGAGTMYYASGATYSSGWTARATTAGIISNGGAVNIYEDTGLTIGNTYTPTTRFTFTTSGELAVGCILSSSSTGGIGYTTGAGGTVTQITSRTTGVTLNTVSGAITLVSAAGLATYQTFTVTDSAVAATDTVSINQKSGTDIYIITIHAVGAGSFQVSYATTGGTTTEQPVFQFNVIKGSNS